MIFRQGAAALLLLAFDARSHVACLSRRERIQRSLCAQRCSASQNSSHRTLQQPDRQKDGRVDRSDGRSVRTANCTYSLPSANPCRELQDILVNSIDSVLIVNFIHLLCAIFVASAAPSVKWCPILRTAETNHLKQCTSIRFSSPSSTLGLGMFSVPDILLRNSR